MKKVLFATSNPAKVKRFADRLLDKGIELITLKDINLELDVEENGETAIENALIKARAYYNETKLPVMAMDDTLYLERVPDNLQPGMYVRRVNGKKLSDEEMIEYYSSLADKYGDNGKITARWIYGMAIINNGIEYTYTWSKEDFYITNTKSNKIDPGYPLNSISINKKLNKYFTDITLEDQRNIQEDETNVIEFIIKSIIPND